MRIIYTKEEIQKVMQKHFENTHYGSDAERPIVEMVLSPLQVSIELGPVPVEEDMTIAEAAARVNE